MPRWYEALEERIRSFDGQAIRVLRGSLDAASPAPPPAATPYPAHRLSASDPPVPVPGPSLGGHGFSWAETTPPFTHLSSRPKQPDAFHFALVRERVGPRSGGTLAQHLTSPPIT
jgi:hypothetical protein